MLHISADEVQGFEDQLPGDLPLGFTHAWGDVGDDQLLVTNLHAASGKQALLLDRQSGTHIGQWGFSTPLPTVTAGWLQISFSFRMEGRGSIAHLGLELRNGPERKLGGGFRYGKLAFYTISRKQDDELSYQASLGSYEPDSWYRLTFWLPGIDQEQTAYVQLARMAPNGAILPTSEPKALVCEVAQHKHPLLMFNLAPHKRGFRFYLDDFSTSIIPSLPFHQ